MSATFHLYEKLPGPTNLEYIEVYGKNFRNKKQKELSKYTGKEIAYAQGWVLISRFYDKRCTFYIADTKEKMHTFFRKYGYVRKNKNSHRYDEGSNVTRTGRGNSLANIVQYLDEIWEDGCLFVAAW